MFKWLKNMVTPNLQLKQNVTTEMMLLGSATWGANSFDSLSERGYKLNPIVYACVDLLTQACQNLELLAYVNGNEAINHPLLEKFKMPNMTQSGGEFMAELMGNYLLSGNAYVYVDDNYADNDQFWHNLRPDRVEILTDARGAVVAYKYSVSKNTYIQTHTYPADKVIHIKNYNPTDDYYGHAPAQSAGQPLDTHNSASTFIKALLDNSAMPSGALVFKGNEFTQSLSDDQRKQLKIEIENTYSGARNAGRPMLLEGGLDWKEIGIHPKNMEFMNAKREAARDIALAFGVPPLLLGIPGDNTYSNYKEANRAFYRQSVMPKMNHVLSKFSHYFSVVNKVQDGVQNSARVSQILTLTFDKDKIEALAEEQDSLFDRLQKATFLTDNEKRLATGYKESDEFDKPAEDPNDSQNVNDLQDDSKDAEESQ